MEKSDVIRLGVDLGVPLELTLSCMNPHLRHGFGVRAPQVEHCGCCSKCRERRDAFRDAAVTDRTAYATAPLR
jgi:7-cyano-7-deazaguanine synthase